MSRIRRAYEARFRALLQQARARRLDQGIQWLLARAQRLSATCELSPAAALTRVYEELATRKPFKNMNRAEVPARFFCDAGLGGLARWLRAAGYDTSWQAGIDDDQLLRKARAMGATILTTDSMLMERRVLRDGIIAALWLSPTLTIPEQLAIVFREFGLSVRETRCMSCGGELHRVEKEEVRERIPPRTYRWREEYFLCGRCCKLFWHGTHWERIQRQLAKFSLPE